MKNYKERYIFTRPKSIKHTMYDCINGNREVCIEINGNKAYYDLAQYIKELKEFVEDYEKYNKKGTDGK